jgi:acetolactate synthase-1/2/3 large subunit
MADCMKVSDYIIDYLSNAGLAHGYFMIGGALGHLADACARRKFQLHTMHHEQSAAFAAEGQAIVSNNLGLAMATSGPGATNLITGIGSAYFASLPVVFITGQVNTFESNITGKRRQVPPGSLRHHDLEHRRKAAFYNQELPLRSQAVSKII